MVPAGEIPPMWATLVAVPWFVAGGGLLHPAGLKPAGSENVTFFFKGSYSRFLNVFFLERRPFDDRRRSTFADSFSLSARTRTCFSS